MARSIRFPERSLPKLRNEPAAYCGHKILILLIPAQAGNLALGPLFPPSLALRRAQFSPSKPWAKTGEDGRRRTQESSRQQICVSESIKLDSLADGHRNTAC